MLSGCSFGMSARRDFVQVNVRMSENMRDLCRAAADNESLSLVEWIRDAIQLKLDGVDEKLRYTEIKLEIAKRHIADSDCPERLRKAEEEIKILMNENFVLKREIFDLYINQIRQPNKENRFVPTHEITEEEIDKLLTGVRRLISLPKSVVIVDDEEDMK